jgi:hypothetical protein
MKLKYYYLTRFRKLSKLFYEVFVGFSLYIVSKILSIFKLSHNFSLSFNLFKFLFSSVYPLPNIIAVIKR